MIELLSALLNADNINRFLTVLSLILAIYCFNELRTETAAFERDKIALLKSVDAIQIEYNNLRFKALRDSSINAASTMRVVSLLSNTLNNVMEYKKGNIEEALYSKNNEDLMQATERELSFQKDHQTEQNKLLEEVVALQKSFSEVKFSTLALAQQKKRLSQWKILWTLGIIIGIVRFIWGVYRWSSTGKEATGDAAPKPRAKTGKKSTKR